MNYTPWPGIGLSDTPVDWAKYTGSAATASKSTASVERRRGTGSDFSTFKGISRKADENRGVPKALKASRISGAAPSKASTMRDAMATGPKSREFLAELLGVRIKMVRKILQYDLEAGRVVHIRETNPPIYALPEDA